MPSHTKKVGPAGRFGARYGLKIRKKINEIEVIQRQKHKCPLCLKFALKRIAPGIWQCVSCNSKFAGKAYEPGLEKPLTIQETQEAGG
jgi:large subunit ribosomal protein L37Ae